MNFRFLLMGLCLLAVSSDAVNVVLFNGAFNATYLNDSQSVFTTWYANSSFASSGTYFSQACVLNSTTKPTITTTNWNWFEAAGFNPVGSDAPLLSMHFENDTKDSGRYNLSGVDNALTLVAGCKVGSCYKFNNATSYINLTTSAGPLNLSYSNFTISAWIYWTGSTTRGAIVDKLSTTINSPAYRLFMETNDSASFYLQSNTSGHYVLGWSNVTVQKGVWTSIIWVVNRNGTSDGYLNGSLVFSMPSSSANTKWFEPIGGNDPAYIGRGNLTSTGTSVKTFAGSIDEVNIWNRTLSSSEVSALYSAQNSGTFTNTLSNVTLALRSKSYAFNDSGLVSWWDLGDSSDNETVTNVSLGLSGNNNNLSFFNAVTVNANGIIGKAVNVSAGYCVSASAISTTSSYSVALWFNPSIAPSGVNQLFSVNSAHNLSIYPSGLLNYTDGASSVSTTASSLSFGTWHHLVVEGNSTGVLLFLDGSQNASNAVAASAVVNTVTLGAASNGFNGLVDDVKVWNRSLSVAEVTALYNAKYPTNPSNPIESNWSAWSKEYYGGSAYVNDVSGNIVQSRASFSSVSSNYSAFLKSISISYSALPNSVVITISQPHNISYYTDSPVPASSAFLFSSSNYTSMVCARNLNGIVINNSYAYNGSYASDVITPVMGLNSYTVSCHPPNVVDAAGYVPLQLSSSSWGISSVQERYFLTNQNLGRIQQNGFIDHFSFKLGVTPFNLTSFYLDIWRQVDSTWNRVYREDFIVNLYSYSAGDIANFSPSTNWYVLTGDYIGYGEIANSSNPGDSGYLFYANNSGVAGATYFLSTNPNTNAFDWKTNASVSSSSYFALIKAYMKSPSIVTIGDSIIAGHPSSYSFVENSTTYVSNYSICDNLTWVVGASCANVGIGGQTSTQIANRFGVDVVNRSPSIIVIEGGVNDISGGAITEATFLNNWQTMLNMTRDNGNLTTVVVPILCWTNGNDVQLTKIDTWNGDLMNLTGNYSNVVVLNNYKPTMCINRTSGYPSNYWNITPSYSADGIHFNQAGYGELARLIALKLNGKNFDAVLPIGNYLNQSAVYFYYYNNTYPIWPNIYAGYSFCSNLTVWQPGYVQSGNNVPIWVNLTNLTKGAANYDVRIANESCGNGIAQDVPRDVVSSGSTWAQVVFEVNFTGVNRTYSVYYNNPFATAPVYASDLVNGTGALYYGSVFYLNNSMIHVGIKKNGGRVYYFSAYGDSFAYNWANRVDSSENEGWNSIVVSGSNPVFYGSAPVTCGQSFNGSVFMEVTCNGTGTNQTIYRLYAYNPLYENVLKPTYANTVMNNWEIQPEGSVAEGQNIATDTSTIQLNNGVWQSQNYTQGWFTVYKHTTPTYYWFNAFNDSFAGLNKMVSLWDTSSSNAARIQQWTYSINSFQTYLNQIINLYSGIITTGNNASAPYYLYAKNRLEVVQSGIALNPTPLTISFILFTNCDPYSISTTPSLISFLLDEINDAPVYNGSMQMSVTATPFNVSNYTVSNVTWNLTGTGSYQPTLCIYPPSAIANVTATVSYTAPAYVNRNYFFFGNLSNVPAALSLYLLQSSSASELDITLQDSAGAGLTGYIIQAQRYFAASNAYKVVAQAVSDYQGRATMHIDAGADSYKFVVEDSAGNWVTSYNPVVINSQLLIALGVYAITFKVNPGSTANFAQNGQVAAACSFTNATGQLVCTVTDPTQLATSSQLVVQQSQGNDLVNICSAQATSSSATLICSVPAWNNSYFKYALTLYNRDGSSFLAAQDSFDYRNNLRDFGAMGVVITLLVVLTAFFLGAWNPTVAMVLSGAGFILSYLIGAFNVAYGTLIGFLLVIVLIIWKSRA